MQEARAYWGRAAVAWNDYIDAQKDRCKFEVIAPAMMSLLPDWAPAGRGALDLGCGEGFYARRLAALGYRVTGVDHSAEMVDFARRKSDGIAYDVADAAALRTFEEASFDLVLGGMMLDDVPDYQGTIAEAHRVLAPGGYFVFSIGHPCFEVTKCGGWDRDRTGGLRHFRMDRYFEQDAAVVKWSGQRLAYPFETIHYHRTVSAYFNALSGQGFVVEQMLEPAAPESDSDIDLNSAHRVAHFLAMRCRKER